MEISVQALADLLGGSVEGNPDVLINRPSKIEEGGEGSISFLGNSKYENFAYTTTASALLVSNDFSPKKELPATLIRVEDVYASVAFLLNAFGKKNTKATEETYIHPQATVHPGASIGQGVHIGPFCVVEDKAILGDQVHLSAQVFVGENAKIGTNSWLYPGVRIMSDCIVGAQAILHANVVIGSDGFGFAPQPDGSYQKIAQIGNVLIEDRVEIGANTCIDRATMGSTILRKGVKLDNLVQIAHNVEIGENTVIAAQTGIAGSTKIGKNCQIGGQAGFAGHIKVADRTKVQGQSGVSSSIEETDTAWFGTPAIPYNQYMRAYAVFKQLPEIYRKLVKLLS